MTAVERSVTVGDEIGLAVVGAGYWGPNLVRNAQLTPALRLRRVCDVDLDRARQVVGRYSTVQVTDDYAEVLADPAVQAVAIATPATTHLALATAALRAGKHVLLEKPMAASHAEALQLVAEADAAGLVLMLDHTYCYTPVVQHLRGMVDRGELGELQYWDSVRINLGLVRPDLDVVWDLAPHDLAILDLLLPDPVVPVAVAAHGSDPLGRGQVSVAHLAVQLSNGALAHLHVNWLSPTKIRTVIIGGSQRTAVWDDLSPTQRLAVYDRGVDAGPVGPALDERARHQVAYRIGDMIAPALPEKEALRAVMTEFAAAVLEGRAPLTDGRSGLRVMAMLEAASTSLRTDGARVPVEVGA
jgi:predicted dehydrogenase